MKKQFLTAITLLLFIVTNAQGPHRVRRANLSPEQSSWLANYINSRNNGTNTNANETIISERTEGQKKAQVGVNLALPSQPYTNNGRARREESENISCRVQPKKMNYLTDGGFSVLDRQKGFDFFPGEFINPGLILNSAIELTPYMTTHSRSPYKIGISIFNRNSINEITVSDFNTKPQAKIQDSLLVGSFGASIPSNGILEITEIKSAVQLAASLNYSYGVFLPLEEFDIPIEITAGIKMEGQSEQDASLHYFVVSFTQPLYTLNLLTNPIGLFANQAHLSSNTDGAYISKVTYGRKAFFIFAAADHRALQSAMFDGGVNVNLTGGQAAGVEAGVKAEGRISASVQSSIKRFWGAIYGGDGSETLTTYNDLSVFHTAFKNYLTASSARRFTASTNALPLSYSLCRISDGAPIAVRSLDDFDEKIECNTNSYSVHVNFEEFKVNKVVEAWGDTQEDIWGTFSYTGRSTNSTNTTDGNSNLFTGSKNSAISRGEGQSYDAGDNPKRVIASIGKSDLKNTILNFSEDIKDWEFVTTPRFDPTSGSALQFNFEDKAADINSLQPGGTKNFYKEITLYENGDAESAKLTVKLKIMVKRI